MKLREIRVFPAVAVAAGALLLLKTGSLLLEGRDARPLDIAIGKVIASWRGTGSPLRLPDPETTGSTAPAKEPPKEATKEPPKPQPGPEPPQKAPLSPAERGLLERLGERREQLEQRQRELELREEAMKAADRKLEQRLQEIRESEAKAAAMAKAEQPDTALKNLVTMYETMKPKEAARVFDRLDLGVLVPVVTAMNARKMAEVLAAMSPEAASRLTVELANRANRTAAPPGGRNMALPPGELPAIEIRKP